MQYTFCNVCKIHFASPTANSSSASATWADKGLQVWEVKEQSKIDCTLVHKSQTDNWYSLNQIHFNCSHLYRVFFLTGSAPKISNCKFLYFCWKSSKYYYVLTSWQLGILGAEPVQKPPCSFFGRWGGEEV